MSEEWLWCAEELEKFFTQSVVGYYKTNVEAYKQEGLLPEQRLVMLFGRPGVGKKTALMSLCREHNMSMATMDGQDLYEGTSKIELDYEKSAVQVLIIEHANDLISGAYATTQTREFALGLKKLVQSTRLFIFCLMDVQPMRLEQVNRDILAVQCNRNFNATIFFNCPRRDKRQAIFEHLFTHVFEALPDLKNSLTVVDYSFLADSSAYTTPAQMKRFVQKVTLLAVQTRDTVVDRDLLKRCMHLKSALTYAINQNDNAKLEHAFSAIAGISIPTSEAEKKHAKIQEQNKRKVSYFVAEVEEEEEEEDGAPSPKKSKTED